MFNDPEYLVREDCSKKDPSKMIQRGFDVRALYNYNDILQIFSTKNHKSSVHISHFPLYPNTITTKPMLTVITSHRIDFRIIPSCALTTPQEQPVLVFGCQSASVFVTVIGVAFVALYGAVRRHGDDIERVEYG